MNGKCKDCDYWTELEPGGFGGCDRIRYGQEKDVQYHLAVIASCCAEEAGDFLTAPWFGCVLFEQTPDDVDRDDS